MTLVLESACFHGLAWRADLPLGAARDAVLAQSGGGEPDRTLPGLLRIIRPDGHQVLLVERTGRVQIRVAYTTPRHARRAEAERVYAELREAATQARAS